MMCSWCWAEIQGRPAATIHSRYGPNDDDSVCRACFDKALCPDKSAHEQDDTDSEASTGDG